MIERPNFCEVVTVSRLSTMPPNSPHALLFVYLCHVGCSARLLVTDFHRFGSQQSTNSINRLSESIWNGYSGERGSSFFDRPEMGFLRFHEMSTQEIFLGDFSLPTTQAAFRDSIQI